MVWNHSHDQENDHRHSGNSLPGQCSIMPRLWSLLLWAITLVTVWLLWNNLPVRLINCHSQWDKGICSKTFFSFLPHISQKNCQISDMAPYKDRAVIGWFPLKWNLLSRQIMTKVYLVMKTSVFISFSWKTFWPWMQHCLLPPELYERAPFKVPHESATPSTPFYWKR
jgi:hypothetical protein